MLGNLANSYIHQNQTVYFCTTNVSQKESKRKIKRILRHELMESNKAKLLGFSKRKFINAFIKKKKKNPQERSIFTPE